MGQQGLTGGTHQGRNRGANRGHSPGGQQGYTRGLTRGQSHSHFSRYCGERNTGGGQLEELTGTHIRGQYNRGAFRGHRQAT